MEPSHDPRVASALEALDVVKRLAPLFRVKTAFNQESYASASRSSRELLLDVNLDPAVKRSVCEIVNILEDSYVVAVKELETRSAFSSRRAARFAARAGVVLLYVTIVGFILYGDWLSAFACLPVSILERRAFGDSFVLTTLCRAFRRARGK